MYRLTSIKKLDNKRNRTARRKPEREREEALIKGEGVAFIKIFTCSVS